MKAQSFYVGIKRPLLNGCYTQEFSSGPYDTEGEAKEAMQKQTLLLDYLEEGETLITYSETHFTSDQNNGEIPEEMRRGNVVDIGDFRERYAHRLSRKQLIDAGIAPLVLAMSKVPNVLTAGSCSGHLRQAGYVQFRAKDDDIDGLMNSPFVRELAENRQRGHKYLSVKRQLKELECHHGDYLVVEISMFSFPEWRQEDTVYNNFYQRFLANRADAIAICEKYR